MPERVTEALVIYKLPKEFRIFKFALIFPRKDFILFNISQNVFQGKRDDNRTKKVKYFYIPILISSNITEKRYFFLTCKNFVKRPFQLF